MLVNPFPSLRGSLTPLFPSLRQNRDPALADAFDPIEVEERRRLWYILVALDWLDQSGRVSTVSSHQYDTQEPTNAFDTDITDSGVTARPFPTFTPALFLALQNQIGTYSHTIGEGIYSIKPGEPVTPAKLAELNAGLERMKATLPALKWVEGVVEPLSEENYSSDRFRVQAHSAVLQLVIRVNRPLCVVFSFNASSSALTCAPRLQSHSRLLGPEAEGRTRQDRPRSVSRFFRCSICDSSNRVRYSKTGTNC